MKRIFSALILCNAMVLSAQTTMNIYQSNGTVLQIPLASIDSITYTVGNPGNLATLTTLPVGSIGNNSAVSGGNVTSDGGTTVTHRGVCWGMTPNPTTANSTSLDGAGTGSYTSTLSGLQAGITYYVRAYATNSAGTAYGNQFEFTTSGTGSGNLATLTTLPVEDITTSSAKSGGNITDDGGLAILYRGICWSTQPEPTTADNTTWNGEGMGSYTSHLTGLQLGITYYVRAYAITSAGTAYGNELNFTTLGQFLPTVTTLPVEEVTAMNVLASGNVEDEGDTPVTARGFSISTSPNPTGLSEFVGNGGGAFSTTIANLQGETTYYLRAFARNAAGITYGNEVSFTTTDYVMPTVVTLPVVDIGFLTATAVGDITDQGDLEIWERGLCWSLVPNPTKQDAHETIIGGDLGQYSVQMAELFPDTTYYVRAYAEVDGSTVYGNEVSFSTQPVILPEVITLPPTEIGLVSATFKAEVLDFGNTPTVEVGFKIGTEPNVGIDASGVSLGVVNSIGMYSGHVGWESGDLEFEGFWMAQGETYYIRAYVRYEIGQTGISQEYFSLGNEIQFTTDSLRIITLINDVGAFTASGTGTILNEVDLIVGDFGVVWDTVPNPIYSWPSSGLSSSDGVDLGDGTFLYEMEGLRPNTTYYAKARVQGPHGYYGHGNEVVFTTNEFVYSTNPVTNIGFYSATCGGTVLNQIDTDHIGGQGVCWSTTPDFTGPSNCDLMDWGGDEEFTGELHDLAPNTTYYARAYAESIGNGSVTGYGNVVSFTTDSLRLITSPVTNIGSNSATCGGTVLNQIDIDQIWGRGVCWSTTPNPTVNNDQTWVSGGGGSFICQLEYLEPNTTYYVRAFAESMYSVGYGPQVMFTTMP